MTTNDNWLLETIVAKSDQLNAVDLIGGPITIEVESVKATGNEQQPVSIFYKGGKQPYKPCKSMRRVLVACWGTSWGGKSMRLYNETTVKWSGESVGGIRISHLSHLPRESVEVQLNESKHKKVTYKVFALADANEDRVAKSIAAMNKATDREHVEKIWKLSEPLYQVCSDDLRLKLEAARDAKLEALS